MRKYQEETWLVGDHVAFRCHDTCLTASIPQPGRLSPPAVMSRADKSDRLSWGKFEGILNSTCTINSLSGALSPSRTHTHYNHAHKCHRRHARPKMLQRCLRRIHNTYFSLNSLAPFIFFFQVCFFFATTTLLYVRKYEKDLALKVAILLFPFSFGMSTSHRGTPDLLMRTMGNS